MILVFGGTTEGREAVATLDEAASPYFYSTRGDSQHIASPYATMLSGAMDKDGMETFCRQHGIRLIVDAAHPFATRLHLTIAEVAIRCDIPVIRLERRFPPRDKSVIWCDDFDDAINRLKSHSIHRLLALTGVQTISRLAPWWSQPENECWFRILDRDSSHDLVRADGFPENHIVYFNDDTTENLLKKLSPQAIITKESGESGGFSEKIEAARRMDIKIFAICRPELPDTFLTVTGRHGLRRNIERLLPGFYPLHTGFTTGSCATAGAVAAMSALLSGNADIDEIPFSLPDGEVMKMPVESVVLLSPTSAKATVVKDAGDDPDITNGRRIEVQVDLTDKHSGVELHAGEGIGTVTLPGLGLEVGSPAINTTPRAMIKDSLSKLYDGGVDVTVSVPGGAELALKTFNPRLGIQGGISIIGTSGIVRPFSHEAFVESMRREMEVALAIGCRHIVLNSGAKSQRFVATRYPDYPPQAFIHYGNAVGEAVSTASALCIPEITVGLMLGKAVKLAEGQLDTHSRKSTFNRQFLIDIADETGCSPEALKAIGEISLVRELWDTLTPSDSGLFFPRILKLCRENLSPMTAPSSLTVMLISDDGKKIYEA